jgi:hypothetical protein
MEMKYRVERTIDATPEQAWGLLADASTYPAWNKAVVSLEGSIAAGSTIKLVSIANPGRAFSLKVVALERPHRMVWADGMPLGLFKGERTFLLEPEGAGTRFSMVEEYTGLLAGMIFKSIPDLTDSFNQFADGLKAAAEKRMTEG